MAVLRKQIATLAPEPRSAIVAGSAGALMVIGGVLGYLMFHVRDRAATAIAVAAGLFGVALLVGAAATVAKRVVVYDSGVTVHAFLKATSVVTFTDVRSFSYKESKAGKAVDSTFTLTTRDNKSVTFSVPKGPHTKAVEDLRRVLADRIASTMAASIDRRGAVEWLPARNTAPARPAVSILSTGYSVRDGGSERRMSFDEVEFLVERGGFALINRRDKKPVVRDVCTVDNFYPGYALVRRLTAADDTTRTRRVPGA